MNATANVQRLPHLKPPAISVHPRHLIYYRDPAPSHTLASPSPSHAHKSSPRSREPRLGSHWPARSRDLGSLTHDSDLSSSPERSGELQAKIIAECYGNTCPREENEQEESGAVLGHGERTEELNVDATKQEGKRVSAGKRRADEIESLLVYILRRHAPIASVSGSMKYKRFVKEIARLPELKLSKRGELARDEKARFLQEHIQQNKERALQTVIQRLSGIKHSPPPKPHRNRTKHASILLSPAAPKHDAAISQTPKHLPAFSFVPDSNSSSSQVHTARAERTPTRSPRGGFVKAALMMGRDKARELMRTLPENSAKEETKPQTQLRTEVKIDEETECGEGRLPRAINRRLSKFQAAKDMMRRLDGVVDSFDGRLAELRGRLREVTVQHGRQAVSGNGAKDTT